MRQRKTSKSPTYVILPRIQLLDTTTSDVAYEVYGININDKRIIVS